MQRESRAPSRLGKNGNSWFENCKFTNVFFGSEKCVFYHYYFIFWKMDYTAFVKIKSNMKMACQFNDKNLTILTANKHLCGIGLVEFTWKHDQSFKKKQLHFFEKSKTFTQVILHFYLFSENFRYFPGFRVSKFKKSD